MQCLQEAMREKGEERAASAQGECLREAAASLCAAQEVSTKQSKQNYQNKCLLPGRKFAGVCVKHALSSAWNHSLPASKDDRGMGPLQSSSEFLLWGGEKVKSGKFPGLRAFCFSGHTAHARQTQQCHACLPLSPSWCFLV